MPSKRLATEVIDLSRSRCWRTPNRKIAVVDTDRGGSVDCVSASNGRFFSIRVSRFHARDIRKGYALVIERLRVWEFAPSGLKVIRRFPEWAGGALRWDKRFASWQEVVFPFQFFG